MFNAYSQLLVNCLQTKSYWQAAYGKYVALQKIVISSWATFKQDKWTKWFVMNYIHRFCMSPDVFQCKISSP